VAGSGEHATPFDLGHAAGTFRLDHARAAAELRQVGLELGIRRAAHLGDAVLLEG
jgi:hypothetical protein